MSDTRNLIVKRKFAASPERVFDAWIDPAIARQWLFTIPGGEIVKAEVDARVGGKFTFVDRRGEDEIEHVGEYLEIDRPRRLVFTFGVPAIAAEFDRITIEIERLDAGCELTLTDEMAAHLYEEWGERTIEGWTTMLAALAARVARKPDEGSGMIVAPQTVRIERILPGPVERVWDYLTDSSKRRQWLAEGPMEPHAGGRVEHVFRNHELSHEATPERFRSLDGPKVRIGTVTEFAPPTRLSYLWPGDGEDKSEVTFELFPQGGEVRLILTHRRLDTPETMVLVASGWDAHLGVLIDVLGREAPRGFWSTFEDLERIYRQKFGVKESAAS